MDSLLIPVTMLATKLGKALNPGSAEFGQAEQAIWNVSVRARSIAEKTKVEWPGFDAVNHFQVPDTVKVVVLEASYRVFKNPQRYVMNQAFQFTGQISSAEMNGDVFLQAERDELEKFQSNSGMWTQTITRQSEIYDPTGYVAVEGYSQPFPYYGDGEG